MFCLHLTGAVVPKVPTGRVDLRLTGRLNIGQWLVDVPTDAVDPPGHDPASLAAGRVYMDADRVGILCPATHMVDFDLLDAFHTDPNSLVVRLAGWKRVREISPAPGPRRRVIDLIDPVRLRDGPLQVSVTVMVREWDEERQGFRPGDIVGGVVNEVPADRWADAGLELPLRHALGIPEGKRAEKIQPAADDHSAPTPAVQPKDTGANDF